LNVESESNMLIWTYLRQNEAQSQAEYALILTAVAGLAVLFLPAIGSTILGFIQNIAAALH
jgi:hypothetical protein